MALKRFEELDASAKATACEWWRKYYEEFLPVMDGDVVVHQVSNTANLTDAEVATEIINDGQGLNFLWNDDGTRGYE